MFALNAVGGSTQEVAPDAGYIIELLEIEPFNQADFDKKKDAIETQIHQEESGAIQKSFVDALRARAKVDINTDLIRMGGRQNNSLVSKDITQPFQEGLVFSNGQNFCC